MHVRVAVLMVMLLRPGLALAENGDAQKAKQRYETGERAYRLGDFDAAVRDFKAAYQLAPVPLILYNIGQAFRLKGDGAQALFFYQQYISTGAAGDSRRVAEQRIAELKAADELQRRAALSSPPPATKASLAVQPEALAKPEVAKLTPPSLGTRRSWYRSPAGLVCSILGLGAAGAGAGLLVRADSLEATKSTAPSVAAQERLAQDVTGLTAGGWVAVGVGGALLVTGIVMFAVTGGKSATIALGPSSSGVVATIGGISW